MVTKLGFFYCTFLKEQTNDSLGANIPARTDIIDHFNR